MGKRNWRSWFRAFHRDIGYAAVALILAYGISGFAVNHIEDWDSKYSTSTERVAIGPVPEGAMAQRAAYAIDRMGLADRSTGFVAKSLDEIQIFLGKGNDAHVRLSTGEGSVTLIERRPLLFEVNTLHLNDLKGAWTYVADAFAIAMIVLAITGMTMMKGNRGLGGRGKWFVLGGLAIPVSAIIYMYS